MSKKERRLEATALWFPEAGHAALRCETLKSPGRDEALVETLFTGISRGTENLVFHGKVPESERERMRGPNMAGDFTFPVKYGYSAVGRVAEPSACSSSMATMAGRSRRSHLQRRCEEHCSPP